VFLRLISGCSKLSLDYERLANEPTSRYYKKHDVLAHHTFSFQGGLSFKEWIVLGEGSHDTKPLKLEKNTKIVGGGCNTNVNGTLSKISNSHFNFTNIT
jgi:hypothetical protein